VQKHGVKYLEIRYRNNYLYCPIERLKFFRKRKRFSDESPSKDGSYKSAEVFKKDGNQSGGSIGLVRLQNEQSGSKEQTWCFFYVHT
jgi:hypothetical protein